MNITLGTAGAPLEQYFYHKKTLETAKATMEAISAAFKESPDIAHNTPYIVEFGGKHYSFEVSVNTRRIVDSVRVAEALKRHGEDIENYKKSAVVKTFNASEAQLLEQL